MDLTTTATALGTDVAELLPHALLDEELSSCDDQKIGELGYCERCDQLQAVIADTRASEELALTQRGDLEREVLRLLARERNLLRQLHETREADPLAAEMREVLDYWKSKLNHPRASVPLDGKRAGLVRTALRQDFTVDRCKRAIDGCARKPYVGPHGRSETGPKAQRYDDITQIFRDEETRERFESYAEPTTITVPAQSKDRKVPAIETVIAGLEAVKLEKPGQWVAKCPAHDDRHASLSVAQGRKGAVVHCHAGCELVSIAAAMGLSLTDFFDPDDAVQPQLPVVNAAPLPSSAKLQVWAGALLSHAPLLVRLVEVRGWSTATLMRLGVGWDGSRLTFPVRDHTGDLLTVARYLPNGKPKLLATSGRARGLFPAPESIDGDTIWLVEGESDAVSGTELGLPAVGVPGVNGWRQDWASRFDGKRVVVCFDCDDPGRQAAVKVSRLLASACEVRVVDLESSRSDGWDLSDALMSGVTAERLKAMASDAVVVPRLHLAVEAA